MEKEQILANCLRFLSIDAVAKAKSGHPGMPCGMADIATVLWHKHLRHNPKNPKFPNRDRFVLSNGHGSMLLYSLLHLTGYDLTIQDIMQFRQLNSKTPGHPEYGITPGVETTTGPLGQGFANAVGMAIAEKQLSSTFNKDMFDLIDHYTYVFLGDGCLMEGISHEAASLAGTLGLGKLIVFYDQNNISIDGEIDGWFTDNTKQRFESYNWHVIDNIDGHNHADINSAIIDAQNNIDRPTLICCKTIIGFGSSIQGKAKTHGSPFSEDEINAMRDKLNWKYDKFKIPDDIYSIWNAKQKGLELENNWQIMLQNYSKKYPELAKELMRRLEGNFPENWQNIKENIIQDAIEKKEGLASRQSSNLAIAHFTKYLPELTGGSADLTESNLTSWPNTTVFSKENPSGRYIHYGVREFAMTAIANGIALHGGFIPFTGTFLVFSDYARNAIRLSSMMEQKNILVYTHDSIGLGEDGPTHQPVEHINSLRMMPLLDVWRPCDITETVVAWISALEYHGTTALVLSRQKLPNQNRSVEQIRNIQRGGYILLDNDNPEIILVATGSEVSIAIDAAKQLSDRMAVRVVSMPCIEKFKEQPKEYQENILPSSIQKRIAIEAGNSSIWYEFIGSNGTIIGLDSFGKSAPFTDIYRHFNLTVESVIEKALNL